MCTGGQEKNPSFTDNSKWIHDPEHHAARQRGKTAYCSCDVRSKIRLYLSALFPDFPGTALYPLQMQCQMNDDEKKSDQTCCKMEIVQLEMSA